MRWEFYLRRGMGYVPTTVQTDAGFYLNVEPVDVMPVGDGAGLRSAKTRDSSRFLTHFLARGLTHR
jgi:hypothetical protein